VIESGAPAHLQWACTRSLATQLRPGPRRRHVIITGLITVSAAALWVHDRGDPD